MEQQIINDFERRSKRATPRKPATPASERARSPGMGVRKSPRKNQSFLSNVLPAVQAAFEYLPTPRSSLEAASTSTSAGDNGSQGEPSNRPPDKVAIERDVAERRYFEMARETEVAKVISETQAQLRTAMETASYCEKQLATSGMPDMWKQQMDEQVAVVQNLCAKLKQFTNVA